MQDELFCLNAQCNHFQESLLQGRKQLRGRTKFAIWKTGDIILKDINK